MDIIFYKSTNEVNSFPKTLTDGVAISGSLRSECDILNPVIEFEGIGVSIPYNYCYIPTFKRYYFITEAKSVRNGILELSMHVDVLQSWANEILNSKGLILRSGSLKDKYILDDKVITYPSYTDTIKACSFLGKGQSPFIVNSSDELYFVLEIANSYVSWIPDN